MRPVFHDLLYPRPFPLFKFDCVVFGLNLRVRVLKKETTKTKGSFVRGERCALQLFTTSTSSERRLKMANAIAVLLAIGIVAFVPAINAFVPARAFVHSAPNMVRFNTAAVQRTNAGVSLRMALPKRCVQLKVVIECFDSCGACQCCVVGA